MLGGGVEKAEIRLTSALVWVEIEMSWVEVELGKKKYIYLQPSTSICDISLRKLNIVLVFDKVEKLRKNSCLEGTLGSGDTYWILKKRIKVSMVDD